MAWIIPIAIAGAQAVAANQAKQQAKGVRGAYSPMDVDVEKYLNANWMDLNRVRTKGGIMSSKLDYLGYGANWRPQVMERFRDESQGAATADEQALGTQFRGYGSPGAQSGQYINNLMKLRAGRSTAMASAMRDLELQDYANRWAHFQAMQGNTMGAASVLMGQQNNSFGQQIAVGDRVSGAYQRQADAFGQAARDIPQYFNTASSTAGASTGSAPSYSQVTGSAPSGGNRLIPSW
jgi:hypothetical protein